MKEDHLWGRRIWGLLEPIFAVAIGLGLGLILLAAVGETHALQYLIQGAFGTLNNFGMTLFYSVPLIFTGLSVAVAFRAGLFNIGAQGQLIFGCFAAAAVGALFPGMPIIVAPIAAVIAAFLAGGFWGFIPGWLRAKTGSHEVITTIMLNFIAAGLSSYATLYLLKNPNNQNPETRDIGANFVLHPLSWNNMPIFDNAPVSISLFIALIVAFLVWFFLFHSKAGYALRAVGENEFAARVGGISGERVRMNAMILAGGLAGMVALSEVLSSALKFKIGIFDYGFMGVAVALLGRCHPFGVVAAAFLFGALHNGSIGLEFESDIVTQEVSMILRGLVILSVSADGLWVWIRNRKAVQKLVGRGQ